jgi:DNA polymerase-4
MAHRSETGGGEAALQGEASMDGGAAGARERRRWPRVIVHVDLDAFFAAVEQRDRPELRGRPVIVGGGGPSDRGVVSAASYEARVFGVRSAMPLRTAARLCPHAVFLPVDFERYRRVSQQVMAILARFSPLVEQVSIDEAFLDASGLTAWSGGPEALARSVKTAIRDEVGLTASVGVATSKLVAKVASDLSKPDGLLVVPPGEEAAFLAPLPVERLWGVGPRTQSALEELGIRTIGQLAAFPAGSLQHRFGRLGLLLHERARGIDPDPVEGGPRRPKSLGREHTFPVDISDRDLAERTLLALCDAVAAELRAQGWQARTLRVKVRTHDFQTITRQRRLADPTDVAEPLWEAARQLAAPHLGARPIRLLGVAATDLVPGAQLALFSAHGATETERRISQAMDAVRHRFGSGALTRARLLDGGRRGARTGADDRGAPMKGRPAQGDRGGGAVPREDRDRREPGGRDRGGRDRGGRDRGARESGEGEPGGRGPGGGERDDAAPSSL